MLWLLKLICNFVNALKGHWRIIVAPVLSGQNEIAAYFWCFPEEYQAAVYKENTPGHFDIIDDKEIGKVYFVFLKFYSHTLRALEVNVNLINMLVIMHLSMQ